MVVVEEVVVVEADDWVPVVDPELPVADVELVVVDEVLAAGPSTRTYEAMLVAACCPGIAKFPTAKPISICDPATKLGNGS